MIGRPSPSASAREAKLCRMSGTDMVEQTTLNQAWGALRVVLRDAFTFYEIKEIAGLAGIDVTRLAPLVQRAGGGASKGQLITALDAEVRQLNPSAKSRVLTHIAEEIVRQRPDQAECLDEYLERLGWQFEDGTLILIELFDVAVRGWFRPRKRE